MADQKISALTGVASVVDAQEFAVNDAGASKKATAAQIKTYIGSSPITVKALTSNLLLGGSTAEKVTGLDVAVGVGTWVFQYYVRYQSSTATTGIKTSVNHSGTVSSFVNNTHWVSSSPTEASSAADQDVNLSSSTYAIETAMSARSKSTDGWGATISVDTINEDMLMTIEGLMVVTVAGDIQLYAGNEINSAHVTIMANSSLILTKIA